MSESEQKASRQPHVLWLLADPPVFGSKADYEEYLAKIRALVAKHGLTPQLERVIAGAEAAIKKASVYPARLSDKDE